LLRSQTQYYNTVGRNVGYEFIRSRTRFTLPDITPVKLFLIEENFVFGNIIFHVMEGPIERVIARDIVAIQKQKGELTFVEWLHIDFDVAIVNPLHGLYAEFVLVDGKHIFVSENFFGGFAHVAQIIAGNKR